MSDNDSICSMDSLDSVDSGKVVPYNRKKKKFNFEPPVFEGNMTISDYMRNFDDFKREINKEKYKLILNFINEWFNYDEHSRIETLLDFKNISEIVLLNQKKPKHNRKIIKKYYNKIIVMCELDREKITDESEQLSDILSILKDALKSIEYQLCFKYKYIDIDKKIKIYYIRKLF